MIDAHCHSWRIGRNDCTWPTPDLVAIHRDVAIGELEARARPLGITACVAVQSQESARDTAWLLDEADSSPFIAGVVGWADFHAADAPAQIARLAARRKLRGLRPMVQDRADDWFDDPAIEPALRAMIEAGLCLDALVRPGHLAALHRLAQRFPALPIVIDHAAKPDAPSLAWRADMAALAACPQVHCKLSGLLTEMPEARARDVARIVLALFGSERIMWGSDWPVLDLAGDYEGWLAAATRWVLPGDHMAIFGDTATAFYRLDAAR